MVLYIYQNKARELGCKGITRLETQCTTEEAGVQIWNGNIMKVCNLQSREAIGAEWFEKSYD